MVVAANGFHRGDSAKLRESLRSIHVPRVKDPIHAAQCFEEAVGQAVEKLGTVRIRHDPDSRRQSWAALAAGRSVRRTINGARLNAAAMLKTSVWPAANAAAPMSGPNPPPM